MKTKHGLLLLLLIGILFLPASLVSAHGGTQVGNYEIEIGFLNEPALQGVLNGLELIVTNSETGAGVTGLEETLQAEIIFGASKKALVIEPVEGEDGAYTAAVLPTALGDYTFHITGAIEGTPVDISMTSSPSTFVSVVPPSEASFPGAAPSTSALEAALAQTNQRATISLAVGVIGLIAGAASLVVSLTRRKTQG